MRRGTAAERVIPAPLVASSRQRRLLAGDRIFQGLALASAILILLIAAIFMVALFLPALPAIRRFGLGFFVTRTWDPVRQIFGALPALYGTLVTSAIGIVIAFPIGLGAALFLAEEARLGFLRGPLSFAVELLAGIPSVVIGLWAFFILTPLMRDNVDPFLRQTLGFLPLFQGTANGYGYLTAGVVLAIMVLPIMVALSRDVIRAVPRALREASLALGATKAETIWSVILPYARVGITGAVLLSLGRALGETIAVTMVIGNRPVIAASLFSSGYTLPSVLANEFTEAVGPLYQGSLFYLGLVLVLITIAVNVLARVLVWRFSGSEPASL
ncbi:MAG: phosphate ABC transporter permease subunit PstC [Chloroflexi bacterium]|nr:MAG: phosphate ABC transporter permease subunit PstC [Chloroflexota bacterium]TMF96016.1 MAG: phosphate ABC transporter permease subunit PstC [Chloroflexota bacterium]